MFHKVLLLAAALALPAIMPAAVQQATPDGGPQPARPVPPTFPAIGAADCDQPARRDLVLGPDSPFTSVRTAAQDYSSAWESVLDWRTGELVRRGHWREADVQGFRQRLSENAALMTEMREGLRPLFTIMMPALNILANERCPARERCLALVRAVAALNMALASSERQWRMMADALAAEAARFGVAFD